MDLRLWRADDGLALVVASCAQAFSVGHPLPVEKALRLRTTRASDGLCGGIVDEWLQSTSAPASGRDRVMSPLSRSSLSVSGRARRGDTDSSTRGSAPRDCGMLCVERRRAAWTTASLWSFSFPRAFSAGRTQRRWRRRDCGDNQSERETAWLRGTVGERQRGPRRRRARQAARCAFRWLWRRILAIHLSTEMNLAMSVLPDPSKTRNVAPAHPRRPRAPRHRQRRATTEADGTS